METSAKILKCNQQSHDIFHTLENKNKNKEQFLPIIKLISFHGNITF